MRRLRTPVDSCRIQPDDASVHGVLSEGPDDIGYNMLRIEILIHGKC